MDEFGNSELLRQYVREGSEQAFAALVGRYLNLVYSAALRKTGDVHAAEEIAQAVFVILARKAHRLRQGTVLSGWLYQATRLTAENFRRTDRRRVHREQEAYVQSLSKESELEAWQEIKPVLEDAMGTLGEKDRNAVVLRFFEGKSFQEIGTALQASENAAKKRVAYALEKLHRYFRNRGVSTPAEVLEEAIAAHSVSAAPALLAQAVTLAAMAKGAASSGSTLALINGALKMMAWTQTKTAVGVGVGILLAAGATTVTVKEIRANEGFAWQVPRADFETLRRVPPQVVIVPSRFKDDGLGGLVSENDRVLGIAQHLESVVMAAYGMHDVRTVLEGGRSKEIYDFIANLPDGRSRKALQAELRRRFGDIARLENRETNVLVLKSNGVKAAGLKTGTHRLAGPAHAMRIAIQIRQGQLEAYNQPMSVLIFLLERRFHIPIVDRSGLTNSYDMTIRWDEPDRSHPNLEGLKRALADQLGLELVPGRESIEMLVVKKEP